MKKNWYLIASFISVIGFLLTLIIPNSVGVASNSAKVENVLKSLDKLHDKVDHLIMRGK